MDNFKFPISVLLPVYNAAKYLHIAIESILNQTFREFELIIVNDGSTDDSKQIIYSFQDSRIIYIENKQNLGLIKTLNKGINACRGKYIYRMDADDICHPDRLKKQLDFMKKNPETGLCGTWAKVINKEDETTGRIVTQTDPEFIRIALLFTVPFIHPSCCFRSEILKEYLYQEIPVAEDYDLWCRLENKIKMANIPIQLLLYRWHTENISKERKNIQEENKKRIIKQQLKKSGITPCEEDLRIHRLSFSLYSFGHQQETPKNKEDLIKSGEWFEKLIKVNKNTNRYDQDKLRAFLWGRWIILCFFYKQKKQLLFPPFASFKPSVLVHLVGQIRLLSKK